MSDKARAPEHGANRQAQAALKTEPAQHVMELEAALAEKTTLLQELDHRVKNSFQVILSLIQLKSRRAKDASAQRALANIAEHVSALSTAHRLLYADGGALWFDMREFVTDLAHDLMVPFNAADIELSLKLDPILISGAKAAPLALLVNELVGNALKHAFPERRGRLSILVTIDNGLRIVVEDNGVGLARHASADEGFGKTLINMLARQLRATMAWEEARPGTRAVLVVPLAEGEVRA